MNNRKKLLKDQRILLAFVIVAIIAVVSMINPKFIAVKNLITIFQQISVIGILTMAMSMLLISGGIDLSVGNIMVLSGVCDREMQVHPPDHYPGDQPGVLRAGADHIGRQDHELWRCI